MRNKLVIIGAGGHGKVAADIAIKMKRWKEIFFLDDKSISKVLDLEVKGTTAEINLYKQSADVFVGIGSNSIREKIQEKLMDESFNLVTLIHPSAVIGDEVEIGFGSIIMAGAVINSSSVLGKGCIVNTHSSIDHDNVLEDYVHISPGSTLAGTVYIGKKSMIGSGSTIINNISIGRDCVVGAGAVVINDLIVPGIYVGVPAKKKN